MSNPKYFRYKGSSPFEDTPVDTKIFYGRENDIKTLTNLVLTKNLVIVYGKSGSGKTSLLNAGLFESLRKENYLPINPS